MAGFEGGARFPFINLEKALGRAKQLYDADHRGSEMPVSGAFAVWGYSEKSSGGFQSVAALKMYGLLEDAGSKESRKVKLTKHALDYFRDEREEPREQKLKDFATSPPLFQTLFNRHWGADVPDDAVARSVLKVNGELNEQSARAALGIYKENMAFAKLKGAANVSEVDEGELEPNSASESVIMEQAPVETRRPVVRSPALEIERSVMMPPLRVVMNGNRLDIQASVDLEGLRKLQEMLKAYETILEMVQ
jgi:hypothetical protein